MKRTFAFTLALLMFAAVSVGCPAPAATAEEKAPVALNVWYYDDGDEADAAYQMWADAVKEAHPWITLEFETLPYDSGPKKFTVACATGTTPDIYVDGYSRIAPAIHAGLTIDLTETIQAHKEAFIDEVKDGIVDGKNYYITTVNGAPYCVTCNLDLAAELGVADMLPADFMSWSYDDFLAICRKAKEADPSVIPVSLFAGSQSSDAWYYTFYLANGGKITNEELTATVFNSDEYRGKILETLGFFKTLIDEKLVPDGCATMIDQDIDTYWFSGKLLFMHGAFNNMSYYNAMQKEGTSVPYAFNAFNVPTSSGVTGPSASWGSSGMCGFNNNGNEEAIRLAFSVFLEHPEIQGTLSTATGRLPFIAGANVEFETEVITNTMARGAEYGAKYNTSDFGIMEPWWTDFRATHYPQLQDFYTGKIDAETMLKNWQEAGDAVITAAHQK